MYLKKSRRLLSVVIAMVITMLGAKAQQVPVTGTITDTAGEPLPGVTVIVSGTANGTASDLDGNYSIAAPAQGTLQFSYIGYKTQSVQINGRTNINVTMQEDSDMLDELVVVGYGQMKKIRPNGGRGLTGGRRH